MRLHGLEAPPARARGCRRRALTPAGALALALTTALAVTSLPASLPARADIWLLDKSTTTVTFSYDNLGLSRQSGRFKDIEGRLDFAPTDPERGAVDVTLNVAGLSTGVAELDRLLRSSDFFDATRHPKIRFASTTVAPTGDRSGEVEGTLTLLGMTLPVRLAVRWNSTGEHPLAAINPAYAGKWVSGFSAKTIIQRSQWGMKRGIPLLSDEIEIAIEAEFVKAD